MPEHIRSLIVILAIAIAIFYFARKHLEPLLGQEDFVRWRNAWIIITIIAFLSSNFWVYIAVTGVFVYRAIKPIENRVAFFTFLLFVIPLISMRMGPLIKINYIALLSLIMLLPMMMSRKWRLDSPRFGRALPDILLILLILIMVALDTRGTTFTDAVRKSIGFFLITFVPYFVASRSIKDFKQLKTVIIAFVFAGLIAGSIAVFEYISHWLLYNSLARALHVSYDLGSYLGRGDSLRAMASLNHPLVLGVAMVATFGLYLFVARLITDTKMRWLCQLAIIAGLIAPVSRGPWVAAVFLLFVFIALSPKLLKNMSIAFIVAICIALTLPLTPSGQKVINLLPFVGNVGQFNSDYREKLLGKTISIVLRNPLSGVVEPSLEPEMADMVQGEGIVDIVNSYFNFVLAYGIPGLILFVWFFLLAIYQVSKCRKKIKDKTSEEYQCGSMLIATMLALLLAISSVSFISTIPVILYLLAGIMYAYARIINSSFKKKTVIWG